MLSEAELEYGGIREVLESLEGRFRLRGAEAPPRALMAALSRF